VKCNRAALPVVVILVMLISTNGYALPVSSGYLRPALWCGVASLAASAAGQNAGPPRPVPEVEIRQLLSEQVAAWNRGDLTGYMSGYWNSAELTFFSGASENGGWKPMLERYRRHYRNAAEMGRLEFGNVRIETFDDETAVARGRWRLKLPNGSTRTGLFTLMLRRFGEGWRIVHDHSS
jgi:beta-aspartyl-peptidase (threonine type)